jgi:hypothetical protein
MRRYIWDYIVSYVRTYLYFRTPWFAGAAKEPLLRTAEAWKLTLHKFQLYVGFTDSATSITKRTHYWIKFSLSDFNAIETIWQSSPGDILTTAVCYQECP